MVKLRQCSGGSEAEALNHNTSCSAEASPDALTMSGNAKTLVVKNNCTDKMPTKEISFVNGNGNKVPAKESPLVNGNCSNKVTANEIPTVNGHSDKMSAKEVSTINENSSNTVLLNAVPVIATVNGNCGDEVPAEEVPMVNGKCNSGNYLNGTNIPSKNFSYSNVHTSDSLCNEDNSDENQNGFIKVVNKKNRKKNHRKKPIFNLPPGLNTESIRRDSGSDKNCGEKTHPTHLSQKPLSRNFAAVRSSEKSYSSVLVNGQNGNRISRLKNDGPNISSDTFFQINNVTDSDNNTNLPGTCISADQELADLTKSLVVITDTSAVSCKQGKLITKVEMTDVSAQTNVCSQNEMSPSPKECLPSHEEVIHESEKASTPSDYVDVGEISDESSNAAYCDSVDIKQGDGESSNVENHEELCGAQGSNVEYYNEWNGAPYFGSFYADQSLMGNIVSNDSGRGGNSEITYDESMPYFCEFPREKTSQLIGRGGSFKYEIERKSGIKLWVYPHEFDKDLSIISMTGTEAQVEKAKELIRERFRHVTLRKWLGFNPIDQSLSEKYLSILPEGTTFMGVVSCICDPYFFWVQQYGHPHVYSLQDLERRMSEHFNTVTDAPGIDNPTIGSVIAVPGVRVGDNARWIRGSVVDIFPNDEKVVVRYLDHGGDHLVPVSSIRPMRYDFFSMPFFAAQCCLYDIRPTGAVWSDEARAEFTRLCNSSTHPPIVRVIDKTPECYFVTLLGYDSEINGEVDIASHLITKGLGMRHFFLPTTEFPSELQQ